MGRKAQIGAAAVLAVASALLSGVIGLGSLAGAAPSETEQKLESARNEAQLITQRINSKSAEIAELEQRAADASAREQELLGELRESTARSTALNDDLLAAEKELEAAHARYKRAVGILSGRLVEIYKGADVDYISVILGSESYDDLQARADYLEALTDADERLAERVDGLRDEVAAGYQRIADLKESIDEEARRLDAARKEIESVRAAAKARAAEVADARAAEQAALGELQDRISGWELEIRQEAAEELDEGAYLGGPYSIPTYIVMCESGGNYGALNASSGAGGAYQIIPSTWSLYGGEGSPQDAPKSEQDAIAAEIWADSGGSAWVCAGRKRPWFGGVCAGLPWVAPGTQATKPKGEPMATAAKGSEGILGDDQTAKREEIVELLKKAYWMEIETVMSYIANSVNPDGVRAQEIIESLKQDITEELGHAQHFADRIKELYGVVPGSEEFAAEQSYLQPPEHQTDIVHVIRGVIEAEAGAIEHYTRIVEVTDAVDPVTQDMVIAILHDEQGHRRLYEGFLREYEAEGLA